MVEPLATPRRWPRILNAVLAAAGLGLTLYGVISVLRNPFGGMRAPAYLMIWIFAILGLNRGLALLQGLAGPGFIGRSLQIAKWILPLVLPLLLIPALEARVLAKQDKLAARELVGVIAFADALDSREFVAGLAPTVKFPVPVHYLDSGGSYALWLNAPAIDLDGYTLSYAADLRRWKRVHNNLAGAAPASKGRCVLERSIWNCAALDTLKPGVAKPEEKSP